MFFLCKSGILIQCWGYSISPLPSAKARGALSGLWISLLLTVSFCYSESATVEVVGTVECTDCKQMNIMNSQAFSELRVTVGCKFMDQESKAWRIGPINKRGKFRVSIPPQIVADGEMKLDCTANLQNGFGSPCPIQNQHRSSKIIFKYKEKRILGLTRKLKFFSVTCKSKFVEPYFSPPAPFQNTLISQAAQTVNIPRPPPLQMGLYQPLPPPEPQLEPIIPPPAPLLYATPPQSHSPSPTYEKPELFPPVREPAALPPQAPMSNEPSPSPVPIETLKPPSNEPLPPPPTLYEPSQPPVKF